MSSESGRILRCPPWPPGTPLSPDNVPWTCTAFGYDPSVPAAIVALAIFAVLGIGHTYQMVRWRTMFLLAMTIGCLMEVVGYGVRIKSRAQPNQIPIYSTQFGLIVIAPILFAASIYMILSRIIRHVGREYSPIKPELITGIFVGFDIFSFLVQIAGSGILLGSNDLEKKNIGFKLLIAGLAVQVVFFTGFVIVTFIFQTRAHRAGVSSGKWKRLMYALYFASVCVLIRSVFRVIEFAGGFDSKVAHDEKLLYTLDFLMMVLAVLTFIVVHPGPALQEPTHKEGFEL
ncbi:hypothetical protein HDV00_007598 [Rhizophlyctis rosea]|nr:hypothetical protein HDV00_007598 [Rhizophlyctis rosea]